ncbi:MAG: LptA/OstA family protein [Halanaerobiales bacterium]|nr:LptA/OstA family protein [Halanaerobiales bacterium]
MNKKITYVFILSIILLVLFSVPLIAQEDVFIENVEESVSNIEADNIYIDNHNQKINAVGNVFFYNQDLKITADQLEFDYTKKMIIATGDPINLIYKDRELSGNRLELDYKKEVAYLYKADVEIDRFKFSGGKIDYFKGQDPNIVIDDAYYTTCEMEEPHYHYTAKSIQYYPDDKIVGRGIGFWWGERRLLTLPRYVVNIETDEEGNPVISNDFPVPSIGYNGEQGFFIELDYPYEISPNNYGRAYYIRENRNNSSFNFNHNYRLNQNKKVFFEYNERKYTDDEVLYEDGYMKLGLNSIVNENINYDVYLKEYKRMLPVNKKKEETLFNLDLTYTNDNYSINTEIGYDFRNDVRKETVSTDYENEDFSSETENKYEDEKLQSQKYIINQKYDNYSLQFRYQKGFNTDYLPYISASSSLNPDLDLGIGYGYIAEGTTKQHKIDYTLNFNKNIKVNDNLNIDLIQDIEYIQYLENNNTLTNYNSQVYFNINKGLTDSLTVNQRIGYSNQYRDNLPLFGIDDIDPKELVISNTEFDLYYPKIKEHWKLGLDLEYSLPDEEFEKQTISLTHELDCYSYQINYNLKDKSIGFEFNFIN